MKKTKSNGDPNYSKYLFGGVLLAAVIVVIISLTDGGQDSASDNSPHIWSSETDSMFVKDCYNKYKPQIKDDIVKQETTKLFCRCMLEKVKSQYDESEMNRIKDSEIKKWDAECRDKISNSNFLK